MLSKAEVRDIRQQARGSGRELTILFGALADAGRFTIFRLCLRYRNLCVTEVAQVLLISVPAASQQLKIMERSGLVSRERQGQRICYTIRRSDPAVRALVRIVSQR